MVQKVLLLFPFTGEKTGLREAKYIAQGYIEKVAKRIWTYIFLSLKIKLKLVLFTLAKSNFG